MKSIFVFFLIISLSHGVSFKSLFEVMKIVSTASSIDKDCAADFSRFVSGLYNRKLWAMRMFDASAKMNSGISNGNLQFLGDYDLCLSINQNTTERIIEGQYCTAGVEVDDKLLGEGLLFLTSKYRTKQVEKISLDGPLTNLKNTSALFGICVPKSCSTRDLKVLANRIEQQVRLPIHLNFVDELCIYKGQSVEIHKSDLLVYFLLVVMGVLICGSTIYDVYLQGSGFLRFFSLYTNMKKLLQKRENTKLGCLNGIKVIACFWLMLGHTSVGSTFKARNPLYSVTEWNRNPINTFIWGAHYGIDTFFAISGLLTSYIYLKKSQKFSISLALFYVNRYIRLTPTLLAILAVQISLLKVVTDGPYAKMLLYFFIERTKNNWANVLFYTVNFVAHDKSLNHLWYLSSDMQMYFIAPLFLFFIRKHTKKVIIGMVITFLLGIAYSIAITSIKKVGFTPYDWNPDYAHYIFFSTFHRVPSWILGLFCGYIFYTQEIKIPKKLNNFLLFVSLFVMISLLVGQLSLFEDEYNVYRSAVWNGLARPAWSLALCYIVVSCGTGHGGFINSFLSHHVFKVLCDLSYSIYLVHGGVMLVLVGSTRETLFFNNRQILLDFIELCIYTLPLSLIAYLAFEAPLLSLKNQMLKSDKSEGEKSD